MTTNISKRRAAVFPLGHRSSKNKKVNLCFQRVNENTTRAGRGGEMPCTEQNDID